VNTKVLLPLEYLTPGEWADVAEVHGDDVWIGRLAELGVRTGTRLQMLRGGYPCLLRVGGSRLSLRGEDAMRILVRPLAHAG
jgi:Fe2+ transport system protein FeoA